MGRNTNGADLRDCAVVITLYNPYIIKLRVNGTCFRKYICKRINEMYKKLNKRA